jgi:hypothetical protein
MPDMPPLRIKGNESVPLTWFQADGYVLTGLPAEWDRPGPVGAGRAAAEGLLRDRERDRKLAMLTCLSQHRWLTTTQVEALFFTYIRGAQRNLRRLEEWGLIHRGHQHRGGQLAQVPGPVPPVGSRRLGSGPLAAD